MVSRRGIVLLCEDISEDWIKWMAEAELNVLGIHALQLHGVDSVPGVIEWATSEKGQKLLAMAAEHGIDIEFELHAVAWLLPRSEFAEHPEWFRMEESGERSELINMCISNQEGLDRLGENSAKLAQILRPTTHNYYFWQDDTRDAICHCEACSKLSGPDQNMVMINAILKGLKTVDPNARLAFLAYHDTLGAPKQVKPDEGIFLEYAPINRKWDKAIDDESEPDNIRHANLLDDLLKFFDPKETHVLEYWLDVSLFSGWKKPAVKLPFDEAVMERDIAFYTARGIDFVTSFGAFIDEQYVRDHGVPPVSAYGRILKG